ncbi:MAG TPA: T9SS type A sorting domain-containing protein, partial [Saprospiraceae bacterium]|nr:T9SS type A sorting domain-containing protein [Saprospiraceae bacterium]
KYKNPLAKPNIVYVSLSDDAQNDCEISNDEQAIIKQKVSLKDLSTQLTDAKGNAVFYSHDEQNKLFVHNENDILDLCKDTVDINFGNGGGHVLTQAFNGVTQKECAQLDVKLVNFSNSIYFQTSYTVLIKNSGNAVSNPTELHISMDPYQYLDTTINGNLINKIAEGLYVVQISELAPSEEFMIQFYTNILPYVPFDRTICLSVAIIDHNNQCKPYEDVVKCIKIDRAGKNKTIAIKYYEDTNGNCVKDPTEKYTIGHFNTINNNRDFTRDYDSIKYIITKLDTNNISFAYNDKLYAFCQENYPVSIHKDSLYAEIEIPFRTLAYCSDIQLHGAHGSLRPCFERTVSYNLVNDGNINSGPITLSIQLDPELEVSQVFPAPFSVNGNNYVFKVNGLAIHSNQRFQFTVSVPCAASIGESYCFIAEVMETIDPSLCQLQNAYTVENCLVSIGSYDPNDKTIFVSGIENKSNIQKDDEIEYRIRFQNTGTDTAYTVRLEDKLSDKFDIKTIKLTDYSHACTWKVENSILIVTFDDINLVDSFTNSLGSNGFITFKIQLKETIQINDEIRNKASIFFDFNDPIITNEVIKTFGTAVGTIDPKEQTEKSKKISFVPNPTSGSFKVVLQLYDTPIIELSIFNISGQWMKTIRNHKPAEEIDVRDLPSGAYIIKVQTSTESNYGKLIKI